MARYTTVGDDLTWHVRKHLETLRAAGIQWLPRRWPPTGEAATDSMPTSSQPQEEPATPDSKNDSRRIRLEKLELLAKRVAECVRCPQLVASRTQTVFGDGRIDPEVCFIGEGPGREEDQQGLPFVGAAGQLLNRIIEACGFKREEVYICNIVKCRPPGNRTPLASEAENCREYLEEQIELVAPPYICCLGACAAQNLLQTTLSIGRLRGRFHDYRGIPVLCTYHPAYLLRNPEKKRDVWEDMKMLLRRMGRPVPKR